MPDGVLQWFDADTQEASIVRSGRKFTANATDIEPKARKPGARVHFDIAPNKDGAQAVNVILREGTRVSRRQRRFGDLTGARAATTKGTAPYARSRSDLGAALPLRPVQVARAWAQCLQWSDVDTALAVYSPDAVVHTDEGDISGRNHIQAYLEASPLMGQNEMPYVRGDDGTTNAVWHFDTEDEPELTVRSRVERGLIAEQWVESGPPAPSAAEEADTFPVELSTEGDVHDNTVDYAMDRIRSVTDRLTEPVLLVRVKLILNTDPARDRPARTQVTIDVNGDPVRADVSARDLREASDLAKERLQSQLRARDSRRNTYRSGDDARDPGEWRHGDVPTDRPDYYDRPAEERHLVRHKTFAPHEMTPDEAAFDMDQLDYSFYLFIDLSSGEEALIERLPDKSYRLTRTRSVEPDGNPTAIPLTVAETPPPVMDVDDAISLLDEGGEPFVFFVDATSSRGSVVYRRYDGHYGLITPN